MWPSFCLFTGRYMWSALSANGSSPGAASSHPSAHRGPSLSHVNGHDGPATLSPAAAASLYSSRVSPLDALYSSPFHTSPTALSFRGLSPGKSHLFFYLHFLAKSNSKLSHTYLYTKRQWQLWVSHLLSLSSENGGANHPWLKHYCFNFPFSTFLHHPGARECSVWPTFYASLCQSKYLQSIYLNSWV